MKKRMMTITAAVCMAAVLAAGCAKKEEPAATQAPQTEEETEPAAQEETEKADEKPQEASERYHMLQGTVTEVSGDGSSFALLADDGNTYEINLSDIRDVETELETDGQIAIAYIGQELGELEDVELVIALPEQEEWTIYQETGTTIFNAMSSFTMKTDEGHELSLIKGNCPMEEGALSQDSGDVVTVAYVTSQGMNFPIEILAAAQE